MSILERMIDLFMIEAESERLRSLLMTTHMLSNEQIQREQQNAENRSRNISQLTTDISQVPPPRNSRMFDSRISQSLRNAKSAMTRLMYIVREQIASIEEEAARLRSEIISYMFTGTNIDRSIINRLHRETYMATLREERLQNMMSDRIPHNFQSLLREAETSRNRAVSLHTNLVVARNNQSNNNNNTNNVQERSPNLSKQITNEEWNNNNTEVEIRMKKLKTYTPRQQKYLMKVDKKIYDSRDLQQWINSGRETIPHSRNPITARLRARIDKRVQGISNNNDNNNVN